MIWSEEDKKLLIERYSNTEWEELLELFPTRSKTSLIQKAFNLNIKGRNDSIYKHNQTYFSEPNIENSYWAGFIAADGCIFKSYKAGTLLSIGLALKDYEHLLLFSNTIEYTGTIKTEPNAYRLQIHNCSQVHKDLCKYYNILSRKSLTLMSPNIVNPDHVKAFVVGYIDGDGCISKRNEHMFITILGTKELLYWIKEQITGKGRIYQLRDKNTYRFQLSHKSAREFMNVLYTVNVPRLNRKWNKYAPKT